MFGSIGNGYSSHDGQAGQSIQNHIPGRKPLKSGSMLSGVVERLHHHWSSIAIHRTESGVPLPEWVHDSDLVIQRGLSSGDLNEVRHLEASGVRCVNRVSAATTCTDRWTLLSTLRAHDIPIPHTRLVPTWTDVRTDTNGLPVVVKARDAAVGRGSGVFIAADGDLPTEEPFTGPFLLQEYLENNPTVSKVYVAGDATRGLVKAGLETATPEGGNSVPFEVNDQLRELALDVAKALQLDIFNVDVLHGTAGPTVIDVNPFPGFRGIPDAHRLIADQILSIYRTER